jgi:peptidyl-prolyl cis-trans isomerase D
MIKFLRSSGASLGVWIILGVLALAFGLTFGVPSDSISMGDGAFGKAYGSEIRKEDWNYQFNGVANMIGIPDDVEYQQQTSVREALFDAILERRVLVEAGREMGLQTNQRDAELLTRDGHVIIFGYTLPWLGDIAFNYENVFKQRHLPRFAVNEKGYLERQQDELLARTVRDLIAASVVVPENEVRQKYDADTERLSLRYVRFEAVPYSNLVDLSEAEIKAHLEASAEQLDATYASRGGSFTKLPKQAKLRLIQVVRPAPAADNADADAKAAIAQKEAEARAKIQQAASRIAAGEDFRAVAREMSQHGDSAFAGGLIGWANVEGTGSGLEAAVDNVAKSAEIGTVSAIIEGAEGFYLVRVDGRREGDMDREAAMLELAEEDLMRVRGRALAKQTAEEAMLALKDGKKLAELFPKKNVGAIDSLPSNEGAASLLRPEMETTGLFARGAQTIPGLGIATEIGQAAWAAQDGPEVLDRVFSVPTGFVIVGVDERTLPSDEEYAEKRAEIHRTLVQAKANKVGSHFAKRRCTDSVGRGQIGADDTQIKRLMTYDLPPDVEPLARRPYKLCQQVGGRGGQLALRALFRQG